MTGRLRVLTDADVRAHVDAAVAVAAGRRALLASAEGSLEGPPRISAAVGNAHLVFTAGGLRQGPAGFRAYGTWPQGGDQLVAVWDEAGHLRAVVTGDELGTRRTAGLGGAAVDALARADATDLAVLGAGTMAWSQTWATCAIRAVDRVRVFSPRPLSRESFARRVVAELGVQAIACATAHEAVVGADVVLVCTVATEPVLQLEWLTPGCHVSSIGPKSGGDSELDPAIAADAAVVVSDSPAQAKASPIPWFSPRMPEALGDVLAGHRAGRTGADQLTLYCSMGLAGSEVVLAAALLDRVEERTAGRGP